MRIPLVGRIRPEHIMGLDACLPYLFVLYIQVKVLLKLLLYMYMHTEYFFANILVLYCK